jgi:HUS1 checkpoint protein
MRFRSEIVNIHTFTKLTASLNTLDDIAWLRLDDHDVRFTVIPEKGTQVWAVLSKDTIFDGYTCQSAAENNTINLEVPLAPLQRALKSAQNAITANIRLTKKDNIPLLSLTIKTSTINSASTFNNRDGNPESTGDEFSSTDDFREGSIDFFGRQDRETIVTQDVPIRVLAATSVEGLHEPRCREPDVHVTLPNLLQLKSISDRFTKLAMSTKPGGRGGFSGAGGPRLELSANMHGCLRLALNTDAMRINSLWTGLGNPELDPEMNGDGPEGIANHPSTRMKALGDSQGQSEEGWATVRLDGKDWGKVLSVGRLGGRVIACLCHEHAMILYVYLNSDEPGMGESVLTVSEACLTRATWNDMLTHSQYYISSYSQ